MGIEEKYYDAIQRQYPCYGQVSPFTDLCKERAIQIQLSPLVINSYEACQEIIYCKNCKLIISVIGKTWHIGMSTQALFGAIRTLAAYEIRSIPQRTHEILMQPHNCSETCTQCVTLKQVKQRNSTKQNK